MVDIFLIVPLISITAFTLMIVVGTDTRQVSICTREPVNNINETAAEIATISQSFTLVLQIFLFLPTSLVLKNT